MPPLQPASIENKTIFTCGDRPFTGRDVIDAALFRAELEPAWKNLLRLLAAERRVEEQDLDLDDIAIETAAEQFRYEHDLITAEETERWLAERGLGPGDFSAYFVRHYWAERVDNLELEELDYLAGPNDTRKLLTSEVILSGELGHMAKRLSQRVAVSCATADVNIDAKLIKEERAAFFARCGLGEGELPAWLERLERDQQWFQDALAMEAIYCRDRSALLSRQAREREIAALRVPLTRFELETIEFDSLDAAREALLCARDDGMSMEEVAAEGRYPYRRPEILLEQVPEHLQQKFLSVHPGEIIEPIARGDGFQLCRIIAKKEPDVDDPIVRKRVDQGIFDRHFSDLTARYIQWRISLA